MNRLETVVSTIAKVTRRPAAEITRDMELVADLDIDSARALELLVELEDRLGLEISDDVAAELNTVGDIIDHLSSRPGSAGP